MADHGFMKQEPGYATKAIHVGQEPSQWNSRAIIPPISLATTFQQDAPAKHRVCCCAVLIYIETYVEVNNKSKKWVVHLFINLGKNELFTVLYFFLI
jgi:hypothetical protein